MVESGSILGDALGWQDLVWIDELYTNPLRIEQRTRKEPDGRRHRGVPRPLSRLV